MLPAGDGGNINGPSLIRAPDWLPGRLGRYYLYFAHHSGSYIRLAFADRLEGPWKVHAPGTLHLSQTIACRDHIASPDVHVDEARREIRMYFHGVPQAGGRQRTYLARSGDGLSFMAETTPLAPFYLRALPLADLWIGMTKGGRLFTSPSGLEPFKPAPVELFAMGDKSGNAAGDLRHVALHRQADVLTVYFSRIGDAPEQILRVRFDLRQPISDWVVRDVEPVIHPEQVWEGIDQPSRPSRSGASRRREHAVRDPAILEDEGRVYLAYSVAGEAGIALAELLDP